VDKITEDQRLRTLNVCNAEIAECLRDLCFAVNMPPTEHRAVKIGGCVAGLDRACARLRAVVLDQQTLKPAVYLMRWVNRPDEGRNAIHFVGPFSTPEAAGAWATDPRHNPNDDPRWQVMHLSNPHALWMVRDPMTEEA
jgi:hypothetical protein